MLTDYQLKKIKMRRSGPFPNGDLMATCEGCGAVMISTTGPGALNRAIAAHRNNYHRWSDQPTQEEG